VLRRTPSTTYRVVRLTTREPVGRATIQNIIQRSPFGSPATSS
jgi:hypothetical protein